MAKNMPMISSSPSYQHFPVTSTRYRAALAALDTAERRAPCLLLPEHVPYNAAVLRPARAEVRAAWIEATEFLGIDPDMW